MSIKYAILGLLNWKPLTGYEMKKIFEDSSFMYWSGNNNQIYKALVNLLNEGFVTNRIEHPENSPTKKIYTITEEGIIFLKNWLKKTPEHMELKKTFLVQLAWSNLLSDDELNELLAKYEKEIEIQILIHNEKLKRNKNVPDRNPREILIWNELSENILLSLKNELNWTKNLRKKLFNNI